MFFIIILITISVDVVTSLQLAGIGSSTSAPYIYISPPTMIENGTKNACYLRWSVGSARKSLGEG